MGPTILLVDSTPVGREKFLTRRFTVIGVPLPQRCSWARHPLAPYPDLPLVARMFIVGVPLNVGALSCGKLDLHP